ncbi:MAG: ATP-binding protein [Chloroflexota bacterium]|nr:MAG: ATP-binding protein [Chloroflexota bacterium]
MVGLINREKESERLLQVWNKPGPALALLYGRRRVGKTFFLQDFLREHQGIYLLAADSTSLENLSEFLSQVRHAFPERHDATPANYSTWRSAFRLICDLAHDEPFAVVVDEFGALCHADSTIPSVLQSVWDLDAQRTKLKLVLCGSEVGVLSSLDEYGQPLHGRFDWQGHFKPLDYYDSARFIAAASPPGQTYTAREMLLAYGLYGGAGRYLVAIDPARPLSQNYASQVLDPNGIFHNEGETLIRQERNIRDIARYNAILASLASGATQWGEIVNQAHVESATLPPFMSRLQQLGWVIHEKPFGEPNRKGLYRLSDNTLKSWYRYVFGMRSAIQMAPPDEAWRQLVQPDLPNYMGSQVFEGICQQHMARFSSRYALPLIMDMGRWWSRDSQVEIDLVARLKDDSYLFGECKWATSPIDVDDLVKLRRKVELLPHQPWKERARYVLFSAGGFKPYLEERAREQAVLLIGPEQLFPGLELE